MANTFVSTGVTGTSTTPKVFSKSHINYAWVNDKCVNPALGHHYTCTVAGGPGTAKWRYTSTDIIKPPSLSVTGLGAPVRTAVGSANHYMKATWKVPVSLTDTKKCDRAQNLSIEWTVARSGKKNDLHVTKTVGTGVTESQINLNTFAVGSTTYNRAAFWPFTKKKLTSVTVKVTSKNHWGNGVYATATRAFVKPVKPTIGAFSFNSENGHVSATITTDAGLGYAERYDTHYKVTVTDTRTGKTWVATDNTSTATSITAAYDVADYQQLTYWQYVKVTVSAWARGYAGNSEVVSRSYYVSYPAAATIKGADITSKSSSGRCVTRISTNNTEAHPVDAVKLEYLANCEYATASAIPGTATWSDAGVQDDAQCTALTVPVTELIPEAGNYTWIRVKSYHATEAVLLRYSNYTRLKALETPAPTATDERVKILSATAGDDGKSAVVHLGWNASGTDDATGTELSWAEESDAWRSTDEPGTYSFDWSDGQATVGSVTYRDSATITIKNLEEATKYYIRARRYMDGDTITYSPYSNQATCYTSTAPEAVTATCERYVPSGQPLSVYWTFSGGSIQKEWQIISSAGKVIASGKGSAGSARISAARLKSVATAGNPIKPSTKSGSIVTFDADEDTVTPSLKAAITPVQAGSGDPSPTNVRPITGWTAANVNVNGRNFLECNVTEAYTAYSGITVTPRGDGAIVLNGTTSSTSIPIANFAISPTGGTISTSNDNKRHLPVGTYKVNTGDSRIRLQVLGVNEGDTQQVLFTGYTGTFTITDEYKHNWIRLNVLAGTYDNVVFHPFIALESETDTTYEPYKGKTYPVSFGSAGTVYGGTLDVVTGVLTVNRLHAKWGEGVFANTTPNTITTLGNLTRFWLYVHSVKVFEALSVKCDRLKSIGGSGEYGDSTTTGIGSGAASSAPSCWIKLPTADVGTTAASIKAWLDANPIEITYPITPQTYNLTAQQVELLTGQNHVWADTGDVTMKYGHKSTGSVNFNVRVSSGSGFVASENHAVTIIDPPSLDITAPSQMTAQPYSFTASCTTVSDLIVIVTSSGAMGQYPDGVRMQTAGDTIYSDRVSPEWTASEDEFTTTITLPTGLDFWDGVTYNMTVTAVDRTTNLRSDEIGATFDVDWTHKAVDPEEFVTVTPIDEVTEDGVRRLAVEIALTPPTDSAETDVYDIYRMDGGTARLIGEGFPLTHTTADEYAPIGDGALLRYRVALRTVDGDVSFADIEYGLSVEVLRLDWRDGSVELPYNITIGDGYSKDVDIRQHMDGSVDGYWNPNITRKSSLSTDAIQLEQAADIELVRRLARYTGPVFVRTPNGSAFEADVQITNLSASNSHIENIAIDANEIGLTQEFILPTPFELEEEGE